MLSGPHNCLSVLIMANCRTDFSQDEKMCRAWTITVWISRDNVCGLFTLPCSGMGNEITFRGLSDLGPYWEVVHQAKVIYLSENTQKARPSRAPCPHLLSIQEDALKERNYKHTALGVRTCVCFSMSSGLKDAQHLYPGVCEGLHTYPVCVPFFSLFCGYPSVIATQALEIVGGIYVGTDVLNVEKLRDKDIFV